MANLDNRSKRASSVNILVPGILAPPEPTAPAGNINQADRQHIALSYSGILAAEAVVLRLKRTGTIICPVSVTSGDQIRVRVQRVQGSNDVYVLADYTKLSIRTDRTIPS